MVNLYSYDGQCIEMINHPAFITENEKKLASDYVKIRQKLLICEQTTKKDESCAKIDNKDTNKNNKKETGMIIKRRIIRHSEF